MKDQFDEVSDIIRSRRTIKPANMNGKKITDEEINGMLELADWAPTHGRTEPWKFFVYKEDALMKFGKDHAELYKHNTLTENFLQDKYEKLLHNVDKASHLIIVAMKRGSNPKISELEEICAASSAIQNLLLSAQSKGIASMWSTGGMTHHNSLKAYLKLTSADIVLGLIFLGYTDDPARDGKRNIPLSEKIKWME